MKVITTDPSLGAWDSYVRSASDATAYHQSAWIEVIKKSFGHRCHYLAAINDHGEWEGLLPLVQIRSRIFGKSLISVPFVNYGGLISKNGTAARLLLDEAEACRRRYGATYVEFRHRGYAIDGLPTKMHKITMVLELADSVDVQWKGFNAKLRNQIRKAEKSGLKCKMGHLELLDGFYDVFARNMRDLGTPVYAKSFFHNILEEFPNTTRIIAVYYEKKMIAAGIASWFRDTLEIPWASSISDYKALCPNNKLYWEAIKFAIEQGFSRFDFGRSTLNEGTYNFKKQWGAQPVQLYWQYLLNEGTSMPDLNSSDSKYKAAIRIWQRLPISVTKIVGPIVRKNINL